MAHVFPLVTASGTVVAACNVARNAEQLERKVNAANGPRRVSVAEPIPFNPRHTDELIAALAGLAPAPAGGAAP
jgi:hypothetical protein